MSDKPDIVETLENDGVALEREIREVFMAYLDDILYDTEYDGKMDIVAQNAPSPGENTIVVGIGSETDVINAYNGKIGYDTDENKLYFRHDRDAKVVMEINMADNDALWMFSKYVSMNIIQDMAFLSSVGPFKLAQHPANEGISVKDVGARKIWTAKLAVTVKIHNPASMTAEIY